GYLQDPQSKRLIDEIYLVFFEENKSYTGEEMLEIHCHGSKAILNALTDLFHSLGARSAQAGEFTKRAFFNGRIGLSQAEAVQELIDAETLSQSQIALHQLSGQLKSTVQMLRDQIVDFGAHLEASLDYPEEDIDELDHDALYQPIHDSISKLDLLERSYERYEMQREGIRLVISGIPNSGKSSLLNALLKRERAIVTNIAGTTRDHLEESFFYAGMKYVLVDTAGLRKASDEVEKIGIEKALELEKGAHINLYIYDGSQDFNLRENDNECLHLINKCDLFSKHKYQDQKNVLLISAEKQVGLDQLLNRIDAITQKFVQSENVDIPIITSKRQQKSISQCKQSLKQFTVSLDEGVPLDIALVEMYEAIDFLSEITGEIATEDIIDRIFEKFCIGK
ncbi:tRNA uridine-5-carboxymethylaminomethyl(34) synthesis GTPase MnmE, partial [bacterium]|nr:tRNA uridine-5-carboxymethylaminomethyl(34) synthesis GTPase MnmE [bacterium]